MRLKYTPTFNLLLLFALLSIAEACFAQTQKAQTHKKKTKNITGIWRGYFVQKEKYYDPFKGKFVQDKYKYEVQINNLPTNNLEGVTYSYLNTTFYGKTSLQGIFTTSTKNVIIKEKKMLELRLSEGGDACLMTCYLSYIKEGDKEYLKGEYSSENMKNKSACGDGTVYLEKVPTSDFAKEDFLLKKEKVASAKKTIPKKPYSKAVPSTSLAKNNTTKLTYKPGAEDALVKKENSKTLQLKKDTAVVVKAETDNQQVSSANKIELKKNTILPKVLTERKTNFIKTFYVCEGDVTIELYDNGTIDNDTVSVYHNGKPIILHQRLSTTPIITKIKVTAQDPIHEIIMVADNLGEIPPNTSLMKVTSGKKNYQAVITSDLQRNAKVIFEYNPSEENNNKKR
ncbi:MAG: hypothetical protein KF781_09205 [Chitinophagaceae bacterium]|nr:hypothetical protein [Chitinophagaceae bacterium]MCW5905006.1 hypothetical protein [Chitinophagaceae bacterium]